MRFRAYIIALIAGAFFALVALIVFSAAVWLLQLSAELADTLSVLSFGTGCLAAGITIGRLKKQGGLVKGFKVGFIMVIPLIPAAIIGGSFSAAFLTGRLVTSIICGMVGGVIGVNNTGSFRK